MNGHLVILVMSKMTMPYVTSARLWTLMMIYPGVLHSVVQACGPCLTGAIINDQDQLLMRFGDQSKNRGHFDHPNGVTFDDGDHLYVANCSNHRVKKFDINGNYLVVKDPRVDS